MKNLIILFAILVLTGFFTISCCTKENQNTDNLKQTLKTTKQNSLENCFTTDSIIYDVEIIPDSTDEFRVNCLKEFDQKEFVEIIFDAVYSGRLKAFDIGTNEELSIKEVKKLEKTEGYNRSSIGKLQFNESWSLNKETLSFEKKVTWIKMGYEVYTDEGILMGYAPLFGVWMN